MSTATTDPLVEDIEFMLATGEHPARIARRLGTTTTALDVRLRRRGRRDLASRFHRDISEQRERYVTQRARYAS